MSATAENAPANDTPANARSASDALSATHDVTQPVLVQGWTAGRARRARMFAVLLALVGVAAVWSAFQPWFSFATAGAAGCGRPAVTAPITVRTPGTNTSVGDVYSSGCVSGRDIALQSSDEGLDPTVAQALARLDHANTTTAPAAMFGLPRPVSLLLIFVGLGVVALASRNGFLGLMAIVGFYYTHKDLGTFTTAMNAGEGGALNQPLVGFEMFGWALVLGWGLLAAATLFIAKHNADQRAIRKREALAAGETPPPGLLDHVLTFAGQKLGVAIDAAQRERTRAPAE